MSALITKKLDIKMRCCKAVCIGSLLLFLSGCETMGMFAEALAESDPYALQRSIEEGRARGEAAANAERDAHGNSQFNTYRYGQRVPEPSYIPPTYSPSAASTRSQYTALATVAETQVQQVENVNNCVRFESGRVDGNASWFKLHNTCSISITAAWCDSNGDRCNLSETADIGPGGVHESWYLNTKYTGISRMACPAQHKGKTVVANEWRCKVMSY